MRAKVAKGLRKSVYGERKDRKVRSQERNYTVSQKGELLNQGARKIYLESKAKYKDLKSKGLIKV